MVKKRREERQSMHLKNVRELELARRRYEKAKNFG